MDFFDRSAPATMAPAARSRGLGSGVRSASGLRLRQDIIDRVAELREYVAAEPWLNEALAVEPGARRGGQCKKRRKSPA